MTRASNARDDQAVMLRASGATLAEIGAVMGVTRQRVQQRLANVGYTARLFAGSPERVVAAIRDPACTNFSEVERVTGISRVTAPAVIDALGMTAAVYRLFRWRRESKKRRRTVALVYALMTKHGRPPTIREVVEAMGWDSVRAGVSAKALGFPSLPAMWRYAGIEPRPRGTPSHTTRRPRP